MSENGRSPNEVNGYGDEYGNEGPLQARRYDPKGGEVSDQDMVVDGLEGDQLADDNPYDDSPVSGEDNAEAPPVENEEAQDGEFENDEVEDNEPRLPRLLGHSPRATAIADDPEGGDLDQDEEADLSPVVRRDRTAVPHTPEPHSAFTAPQRLLLLDIWQRSGLPAGDFAPLVGLAKHTLYDWRRRFDKFGPNGLADRKRGGPTGSRMNEYTRRAVLMLKRSHPDWSAERIHLTLLRSEGYSASADAVSRVLLEDGHPQKKQEATPPHDQQPKFFERAKPNQLWQTDLFTFRLKRENRNVHLVAYMDDNSRFIVGYGLHASPAGVLVREVLEVAIANYGAPEELLTDNGPQYNTWRGKSEFTRLCERRGVKQIIAKPRRPQTLGKMERFWGTLWRELVQSTIFQGLDDARKRIGLFIDHYNFMRPHQGIGGLVPADRFFNAVPEVRASLQARVDKNALELAQHGIPRKTVYLTGKVGDVGIALHSEGDKVIYTDENGTREEVNLAAPGRRAERGDAANLPLPVSVEGRPQDHPADLAPPQSVPGASPLDQLPPNLRRTGGEA